MSEKKNIYEKLLAIQCELKAPKNQYNAFGKYKYRNAEDILEAVKPLCKSHKIGMCMSDEIVEIGDRFYVKAVVAIRNTENLEELPVAVSAYARECFEKKGMDESQITGAASSYARKYALNGLFCIDDTKDADSHNNTVKPDKPAEKKKTYKNFEFLKLMAEYKSEMGEEDYYKILGTHGYEHANEIAPENQASALKVFARKLQQIIEKKEAKI